jgi:hypothetical protein
MTGCNKVPVVSLLLNSTSHFKPKNMSNRFTALIFLVISSITSTIAQNHSAMENPGNLKIAPGITNDQADKNNNFYDNEKTYLLPLSELTIAGEVENPGIVDFSKLQKRSVIVKEALLNDSAGNRFVGAYRYDGYSLFDILNDRIIKKKNSSEFKPIIDLFVVIENRKGEKVVLSWGEIYYPNFLHNIIIASEVMRIVPSKTKDLWPLPVESKLVVGQDLISERNILSPSKITVISYPRFYAVNRELSPMVSETVNVFMANNAIGSFTAVSEKYPRQTLHTIFYGKGRGIHSTQPFTGILVKNYLDEKAKFDRDILKTGIVIFAGVDGYRAVYSFSEIMNRSDQEEILLVSGPMGEDGGNFRIFPSCDFFSDRAVKALNEIRIEVLRP